MVKIITTVLRSITFGILFGVLTLVPSVTRNISYAQSVPITQGWSQLSNTKIASVCAAINGFPQVSGTSGCDGIFAWSSAVMDTKRNRMIVTGGGHNDYDGNEIYALNLSANPVTMTRLTDPGLPTASTCQESIANGTQPNSRHTYDGIEYMPNIDRLFVFSGSLSCSSGNFGQSTWTYDFTANQWQNMNPSGPLPVPGPGRLVAYDPNTGLMFVHDEWNLFSYSFSTNMYTKLTNSSSSLGYHMNATIDPVRKLFVIAGYDNVQGGGRIHTYSIALGSTYQRQSYTMSGCGNLTTTYPGIEYHAGTDRLVGWNGGDTVYSLNLDTKTCTSITNAGGPGAASVIGSGTHGRWRYAPASGAFILVNEYNQDAYAFRLGASAPDTTAPTVPTGLAATPSSSSQIALTWTASTDNTGVTGYNVFRNGTQVGTVTGASYTDTGLAASTTYVYTVGAVDAVGNTSGLSSSVSATTQMQSSSTADFQTRCAAAGVIVCRGFDSASEIAPGSSPGTGAYPDSNGSFQYQAIDTAVKASGSGSFRLTIASNTGQNMAGEFRQLMPQTFGENSSYYVQFRYRVDPAFVTTNWYQLVGTSSPKISIFHYQQATCSEVEWTTGNGLFGNWIPTTNTNCGSKNAVTNGGIPPYLWQQGDYACPYGSTGTLGSNSNCLYLSSNKWMTLYYKMTIGTWNNSNSRLEAWFAIDGGPYKKWVDLPGYTLNNTPPVYPGFNAVTLTPYMTGKNSAVTHTQATVWYDELIVSTQPITAPDTGGTAPPSNPPPAAPTNLTVR